MRIFSLCIFAITVLLSGAIANVPCILEELRNVNPHYFFNSSSNVCRDYRRKFAETDNKLKVCGTYRIDIGKMEKLYDDLCSLGSEYRQKFDAQKECLLSKIRELRNMLLFQCDSKRLYDIVIYNKIDSAICNGVVGVWSICLKSRIGKSCGQEGLEVYGRIIDTLEPFFKAECLSSALFFKGFEKVTKIFDARERVFKTTLYEFETAASNSSNSPGDGQSVAAVSKELSCILQELRIVNPHKFFSSPTSACEQVEWKFTLALMELEKCPSYNPYQIPVPKPIVNIHTEINKMENLNEEFCNLNSEYRRKFDRRNKCLSSHMSRSNLRNRCRSLRLNIDGDLEKELPGVCSRIVYEVLQCVNRIVGEPCGQEGLEVYERIVKAMELFFTAKCMSIAISLHGETDIELKMTKMKHGVVEAAIYEIAGSTSNSALIWCMLLGLFFAVML